VPAILILVMILPYVFSIFARVCGRRAFSTAPSKVGPGDSARSEVWPKSPGSRGSGSRGRRSRAVLRQFDDGNDGRGRSPPCTPDASRTRGVGSSTADVVGAIASRVPSSHPDGRSRRAASSATPRPTCPSPSSAHAAVSLRVRTFGGDDPATERLERFGRGSATHIG